MLVLGLGNALMGDDGVGVAVVQAIEQRLAPSPWLSVLDGGTLGLHLLPFVLEATHLVIVDALHTGAPAGTVHVFEQLDNVEVSDGLPHAHGCGAVELIALAKLSGWAPVRIGLVGVEPLSVEVGCSLSAPVKAAVEPAAEAVIRLLRLWGFGVVRARGYAE